MPWNPRGAASHQSCSAQDGHCPPPSRTKWRTAGYHRLQPNGHRTEIASVLEKTSSKLVSSMYRTSIFTHRSQRKCWWDGLEVDLAKPGEAPLLVKLWARRVWTLELSLVRAAPFLLSRHSDCSFRSSCAGYINFSYVHISPAMPSLRPCRASLILHRYPSRFFLLQPLIHATYICHLLSYRISGNSRFCYNMLSPVQSDDHNTHQWQYQIVTITDFEIQQGSVTVYEAMSGGA